MHRRTVLIGAATATALASLSSHLFQTPAQAATITPPGHRPWLLVPPENSAAGYEHSFAAVVSLIASDSRAKAWYDGYRADADQLLNDPELSQPQLLNRTSMTLKDAREVLRRVYTLALVHHVTNDGVPVAQRTGTKARYFNRMWAELKPPAALPHWNPDHFLDTAEMTHAFAIAYDWTREELDAGKELTLRNGLRYRGLGSGLHEYEDGAWWVDSDTNWNLVCNSGMLVGALALLDAEPTLAGQIIDHVATSMPHGTSVYSRGKAGGDALGGAYPESPMYWAYGTRYLCTAAAALRSVTGQAESYTHAEGMQDTALFALHTTGPFDLCFSYGDGDTKPPRGSLLMWLGLRFQSNEGLPGGQLGKLTRWAAARSADLEPRSDVQLPTTLLWHKPSLLASPVEVGLPLDAYFPGHQPPRILPGQSGTYSLNSTEVVTMRSAWEDPDALWVGVKGGFNGTSHGDMDAGTFVLDALGQRWAYDFGSDNYNITGYGHHPAGQNSNRWTSYRKRAEGHNTIVVNPGERADLLGTADMLYEGHGDISQRHHFGTDEAWAIAILTSTHPDLVHWARGWKMFDDRSQFLVTDELTFGRPSTIWWFCHTLKAISLSTDRKQAVMTGSNGMRMVARVATPSAAVFTVRDAVGLPSSPPPPAGANPNEGWRKLAIQLTGLDHTRLSVQFTPLQPGESLPPLAPVVGLSDW